MKELTFTEAYCKQAIENFNYINMYAKWVGKDGGMMTSAECAKVTNITRFLVEHAKMMEKHIMELIEEIPPPEEKSGKSSSKVKK